MGDVVSYEIDSSAQETKCQATIYPAYEFWCYHTCCEWNVPESWSLGETIEVNHQSYHQAFRRTYTGMQDIEVERG